MSSLLAKNEFFLLSLEELGYNLLNMSGHKPNLAYNYSFHLAVNIIIESFQLEGPLKGI